MAKPQRKESGKESGAATGATAGSPFVVELASQTCVRQPRLYGYLAFTFRDCRADICQCYFPSELQTVMKI